VRHRHPEFVVGVHDWVHQQAWNEERTVYGGSLDAAAQKNIGGAVGTMGGAAGSAVSSGVTSAASASGMGWLAAAPGALVAITKDGADILKNMLDTLSMGGGFVNMVFDRLSFATKLKEANVTGAPSATALLPALFCPRNSTTMVPYFRSAADAFEWRFGLFEMFSWETWWPFTREVGVNIFTAYANAWTGSGDTNWGWVKPRVGFLGGQVDDYKVAGVIAQRAVDIVTNPYGFTNMHIKVPYSGPPANEQSPEDVWQRLAPNKENICRRFGYGFPGTLDTGYQSKDGAYAFMYWRRYECCTQGVRPDFEIPLNICL
ncbi:MAG: TraU family protein, partial [Gammaproteobacteria bacterium]|nr:TraU family protein [Gammaproteobacteria bacterium]